MERCFLACIPFAFGTEVVTVPRFGSLELTCLMVLDIFFSPDDGEFCSCDSEFCSMMFLSIVIEPLA